MMHLVMSYLLVTYRWPCAAWDFDPELPCCRSWLAVSSLSQPTWVHPRRPSFRRTGAVPEASLTLSMLWKLESGTSPIFNQLLNV